MKSLNYFKYGGIIPNVNVKKGKKSHFFWRDYHQGKSSHILYCTRDGTPYYNKPSPVQTDYFLSMNMLSDYLMMFGSAVISQPV